MGQGSGFIITADGYAVTNNHVVQDADEVMVKMNDGEEYKAKVIGTDPKTDLGAHQDRRRQAVQFREVLDQGAARRRRRHRGRQSLRPWRHRDSGIISARGRDIGSGPYDDFLQIDASINRGNSGGPAFDLEGNVVGINTAIFSPSGGSVGIGFAIPASTAQDVVASLKDNGTVTRGWLGVQIQPVTEDIAESMSLSVDKGAIVADVTDEIARSRGRHQDRRHDHQGQWPDGLRPARSRQESCPPRTRQACRARAYPRRQDDECRSRDRQDADRQAGIGRRRDAEPRRAFPISASSLAPGNDGDGVAVVEVKPGSPAEEKGLKSGDVILEVAGKEVHDPADVTAAVGALKDGKQKRVLMLVRSGTRSASSLCRSPRVNRIASCVRR